MELPSKQHLWITRINLKLLHVFVSISSTTADSVVMSVSDRSFTFFFVCFQATSGFSLPHVHTFTCTYTHTHTQAHTGECVGKGGRGFIGGDGGHSPQRALSSCFCCWVSTCRLRSQFGRHEVDVRLDEGEQRQAPLELCHVLNQRGL